MKTTPPQYSAAIFVWITLVLAMLKLSDLVEMSWWAVTFWFWAPGLALCAMVAGSAFLCFVFWVMRIGGER